MYRDIDGTLIKKGARFELIELEFDEKDLGQKWMNLDNLNLLFYTKHSTKKELLKVNKYQELN